MSGHATINRFYRLIWSEEQGAWIAVAENTRGRGKSSGRGAFMAALFASLGLAPLAYAGPPVPAPTQLPTGGVVVGGNVTIGQNGATMTVNQSSQRGAVDWQTFNVGSQAQVDFRQPSASAVTLNRVADTQASQIFGRITANGQVFLSNPNGVYFSPTASVDVGGLVATTHTISTADFMAGKNTFNREGATGAVVNEGQLQAGLGGYIALLAPEVRNHGIVLAQAGTVALAAGDAIELQFENSRSLTGVLVAPSAIAALVENGAAVHAPGGLIIMSAHAANQLQGGVVRNSGTLEATGLAQRGGKIVLDSSGLIDHSGTVDASGAQGGSVTVRGDRMASSGTIRADGGGSIASTLANGLLETTSAVISAQGGGSIAVDGGAGKVYTSGSYRADGEHGGKVVITASEVALMGASVSATGVSQGGTILVGGDYQGKNADVRNARKTSVGTGVTLNADATGNGNGGKIVVWSDEKTVFAGALTARGGAAGGDGGVLEVSGKENLYFGGTADAHAPRGKSGSLLLDPKDIFIDSELSGQLELVDPHPTTGGTFGKTTTALATTAGSTVTRTGYLVVTNPTDNFGATDAGAAYLFRQGDQALISTLYGTHAGDKVGSEGVTTLTNGNFVVSSKLWNGGRGAVSWGSGTTGWGTGQSVAVSSANSLVGGTGTHQNTKNMATADNVGGTAITVLNNGNYLVGTASWSDNRGALTFGNGATGVSGVVSAANSLVGSTAFSLAPGDADLQYKKGDLVGNSVTVLGNGNYVLSNEYWNKGVGAVTLGSGTTGITGVVGPSNSLVGDSTRFDATGAGSGTDKIGGFLSVLTGSQFVVYGSSWNAGAGAVTWFDGSTPVTGMVSAATSLVGGANDYLSSGLVTVLPGNNAYLIRSPSWNGGRGAVTWVPFGTDVKTLNVATNGLLGASANDAVGSGGVTVLANNDFVALSPSWSSGKGAATLVDGTTGKAKADQGGTVTIGNSIVGSQNDDHVSSSGIVALNGNGNFVVLSPYWANGANTKAGAVTWSSGTTPTVGAVGAGNSLLGTYTNDRIGSYQYWYYQYNNPVAVLNETSAVTALSNGNYVISSPMWNGTRGAVTWVNGSTGATVDAGGAIAASNSLVGGNMGDFVGSLSTQVDTITNVTNNTTSRHNALSNGVNALSNGNYVTLSSYWRNGSATRAGALTWSNGSGTPTIGAISASNSLVGTVTDDMVGVGQDNTNGFKLLESGYNSAGNATYSGNYVVSSTKWDRGAIVDAGAVTWGSGTTALTGNITDRNSILGLKTGDVQTWKVTPLPVNGNYVIQNQYWDNGAMAGAGATTWVDGTTGRLSDYIAQGNRNVRSGINSLIGSQAGDNVGDYLEFLLVYDPVTKKNLYTGNYLAFSFNWANGANAAAGAVTWGRGTTGVSGTVSRSNSLVGDKAGDYFGGYYAILTNGNYLLASPTLDVNGVVNAGGVSWIDGNTGRLNDYATQGNQNIMSAASALVGSHTGDQVGTGLYRANDLGTSADYTNNGYFIVSEHWNCDAGSVNYITDATVPLTGVVGSANAAVGNPNGRFWGGLTYNPYLSLAANGDGVVTFAGDNGHVVLVTPSMPSASSTMYLPGALAFGDAEAGTQAMTPDYIANVLKTGTSVTLQANNDIFVKNGIDATGGTAGGALTMQAGRSITVLGDIITGNRDLHLVANDSVTNGVKDAYRDAGIATLSMGSNKDGVAAKIDAGTGDVTLLIASGADKTNYMAGSISVNSITARNIKLVNQGNGAGTVADLPNLAANCCGFDLGYRGIGADITLNAGAVLAASGAGDAVTLAAGQKFNNNSGNGAGAIALANPGARWLVYAAAPTGNTYGGLDSQNTALWNTSYTGAPVAPAGNRYLFAYQPTITVGTQNVSKTYGEDLSTGTALADRVVSLAGAQAAQAGAYLGDTLATALTGTITATSAGAAATAGVAGGPYAITVDLSGAVGAHGYAVALGSNTPRSITVQAKALTAALTGVTKVYDGTNAAILSAGNYSLSGLVGTDAFSVTRTSGIYNASSVNGAISASTTLASGDFSAVSGTVASNYILPTTASGAASITGKALNVSLTGVTKTYDGTASAVLGGANYLVSGFVGSDSATINHTAAQFNSADVATATSVSTGLVSADYSPAGGTFMSNYLWPTVATGAASIMPKALTASFAGTVGKVYDGTAAAVLSGGNFSLTGFVGGQSGSIAQTAGTFNSANVVGATTVSASLSAGDLVAGAATLASNYSLPASVSGAGSIAPKALTISLVGNLGREYNATTGATLASANYSLTGLAGADGFSIGQTSGAYDSVNAGARTLSVLLAGGDYTAASGTLASNYVLPSSAAGSALIVPKSIVLTAPSISKVYDGTVNYTATAGDNSALSSALLGSDSITGATFSFADKNAGTGNRTVNFGSVAISDGNGGANYSVTLAGNSSSTITARTLHVGATGIDRVYDASANAAVSLTDDRIAGDVLDLSNAAASFADKNAGTGKTVTVSGIAKAGADAGNYTLAATSATTTATITPVSLALSGITAANRTYDTTTNVALGGTASITALGNDVVTLTGSGTGQLADKNAGAGKAVIVSGYTINDSNYVLVQPVGLTVTIAPAVLQLGGLTSGVTKTYDGTNLVQLQGAPVVTGLGGDLVSVLGTGTGLFADKNAGAGKAIVVTGYTASDSNYAVGQQPGLSGTINPAQLKVTGVSGIGRAYDGTALAQVDTGSYLLGGLAAGDSIGVTRASGVLDSANAGLRTLTVSLSGADFTAAGGTSLGNYLLPTTATGTSLVTPKAITLSAPVISKVYDGTLAYTTTGSDLGSLSGALVGGDSITGARFSFADKNAGAGNRTVNFGSVAISDGNGGANYSVTLAGNSASTITPRTLTVGATGVNRVYDTTTNAAVTLLDDRIAGDALTVTNAGASYADKNAGSGKVITVNGIASSGADAGNYVLAATTATATGTIAQARLQVNGVTAIDRAYDRSLAVALGGTATVTALGNDVVTVLGTGVGTYADKNAGAGKAITVSGYTSSDSNYVLLQPAGLTGNVSQAVLQLGGLTSGVVKTYDGTTTAQLLGAPVVTGLGGEMVTVTGTGIGQFADRNAGTGKAITVSGYTASDSNYAIGQQPGLTGDIGRAVLGIAGVTGLTRQYDGTTQAQVGGYSLSGLVGGDAISVTRTGGTYDSRNAGVRTLTVNLAAGDFAAASGTELGNYVLPASATGTGTITPRLVTLSAPSLSKVYDGTLGYTTSAADLASLSAALVGGDSVTGAGFSFADKNAGAGNRTVNFGTVAIGDGNGGANYSVTLAGNNIGSITPRLLTVSATAADRTYDTGTGATVTLTDDRILGDELAVANISASFLDKNAGTGKTVLVDGIHTSGADAGNYALASTTATARASIAQAALQVTGVTAADRAYDRSASAVLGGAPTVTALGNDVVRVLGTGVGTYADKNAGTGKAITVSGYTSSDSNYVLLQPVRLTGTITPAVLQVSGLTLAASKTYDGTRVASLTGNAVVTGLGGEVVTVGGNGTGLFADKNVGQDKAIALSGYTSSDSNYVIGQQPGLVGNIVPASVTVAGVRANDKKFDGTTVATLSGTAQIGAIAGDSVTVAGTPTASFADATAGTAKPVTVGGYTLTGADAGNYQLNQPAGLTASIVNTAIVVPPPVVVPPPPLPAAPTAAEMNGVGLTLPPLAGTASSDAAGLTAAVSASAADATATAVPAVAAAAAGIASMAGITVSLVQETTLRQNGVVSVSVPREIANAGQGYSFPLPAQVVEAAVVNRVEIVATTATGDALPAWITFNADSKTFVVSSTAPVGALPLQVQLQIGAQKATMVITEGK